MKHSVRDCLKLNELVIAVKENERVNQVMASFCEMHVQLFTDLILNLVFVPAGYQEKIDIRTVTGFDQLKDLAFVSLHDVPTNKDDEAEQERLEWVFLLSGNYCYFVHKSNGALLERLVHPVNKLVLLSSNMEKFMRSLGLESLEKKLDDERATYYFDPNYIAYRKRYFDDYKFLKEVNDSVVKEKDSGKDITLYWVLSRICEMVIFSFYYKELRPYLPPSVPISLPAADPQANTGPNSAPPHFEKGRRRGATRDPATHPGDPGQNRPDFAPPMFEKGRRRGATRDLASQPGAPMQNLAQMVPGQQYPQQCNVFQPMNQTPVAPSTMQGPVMQQPQQGTQFVTMMQPGQMMPAPQSYTAQLSQTLPASHPGATIPNQDMQLSASLPHQPRNQAGQQQQPVAQMMSPMQQAPMTVGMQPNGQQYVIYQPMNPAAVAPGTMQGQVMQGPVMQGQVMQHPQQGTPFVPGLQVLQPGQMPIPDPPQYVAEQPPYSQGQHVYTQAQQAFQAPPAPTYQASSTFGLCPSAPQATDAPTSEDNAD